MTMLLLAGLALAHSERDVQRGPVAWALAVEGRVTRVDGTWLDAGESIEVGARLDFPPGAWAKVAHNGRIEQWEGNVRVGADAVHMTLGGHTARFPHVEELGNGLTGDVRAPAGRGQESSALGIPLTAAAWARQDAIDGGELHGLYTDVLKERLAAAGIEREVVAKLGLLDALPGNGGEQVGIVGRYLDLAGATPKAALLFEVPPTDSTQAPVSRNFAPVFFDALTGQRPHTFRMPADLDKIRVYGLSVADALRRKGHAVFGLVVPYANTLENIVARSARPEDGVEVLHQLLVRAGGAGSDVPTVAFGYSQGAAVVRDYVAKYGDADGLDYAIPLATMGGVDGVGGDGVWTGRAGAIRGPGVSVLTVVHAHDPARWVYGKGFFGLTPRLLAYAGGGRQRDDDVALHAGYLGSKYGPLPHGADAAAALRTGTFGYPTTYLSALYDDLFADRHAGPLGRRGDWAWDGRVEMTARDRGDYATWRQDPRVVADGYVAAAVVPAAVIPAAVVPAAAGAASATPTDGASTHE